MVVRADISRLNDIVAHNLAMAKETENLSLDSSTVRAGVAAVLSGAKPGAYYVELEGERVIAQLMISYEWSDWRNRDVWWIQSVYVVPEARKRGLYRNLYAHVEDAARSAGAGGIRLYVDMSNTHAQAVYKALGMNGDHYRVFETMF